MCTHYGLTHVRAHALHVCVCTHTHVCRAHEPTAACSHTTDARLLAHACAHTSPRLFACATAAQHQQRCQSTRSACCLLTNPPSRHTRVCTHVCMHVSHMRSSNAAMQQCSSNAAAMQQQCSSNAAAMQQCSSAAMQQQCSSNAASMQQCSINAAAMQPSQCLQTSRRLLPPHGCTLTSVLSHHGSSHARAKPRLWGGVAGWGDGGGCRVFFGGGGFASATVTASLIFVASEKWGRAVVSPREPAAHDGRPPLLL